MPTYPDRPVHAAYAVVIVGGAIMGSSTAWHLATSPDFDGRILIVERDPSYAMCSTAHTNSCIRQQFSTELNIRISQFTAEFVKTLRERMGGDPRVPKLSIRNFGRICSNLCSEEVDYSVSTERQWRLPISRREPRRLGRNSGE